MAGFAHHVPGLDLGRALRSLDDRRGTALRNAWALTGSARHPDTLTQRRIAFAAFRNCSPETVKTWENQAILDLILFLQRPTGRAPVVRSEAPVPPRSELQVDVADVRLLVREEAGIEEVEQRLTVRALVDGVREFRRGVWSSARPLVADDVTAVTGGALVDIIELRNDGRQLVFEFPHPLQAGRSHSFSWRRRLAAPDDTPYWTYNPQFRGVDLQVSALFADTTPSFVWEVDNLFVRESPGVPSEMNRLTPSGANFFVRSLVATPGKESGIAWEW